MILVEVCSTHPTQPPQMVPLVKTGCDTLVQKFGEAAESQQSVDVHK